MSHAFSDYDRWKLRSPYDDDLWHEDEPEPCDHDEYDVDLIEGRATCDRCGESWGMSDGQMKRHFALLAEYERWERWEHHPLNRLKGWLLGLWLRLRPSRPIDDDEIPF